MPGNVEQGLKSAQAAAAKRGRSCGQDRGRQRPARPSGSTPSAAARPKASADMRNLLGGKGADLAEMANLGLPVPPGFTITTEVCTHYYANGKTYPKELEAQVDAGARRRSARITGKTFGDRANPLLVSVRSGARASMPGMMDTVLNLGLNDETVEALAQEIRRPALRLRQLPPLHHDVFRRGARRRASSLRGDPRRPQGRATATRSTPISPPTTGSSWSRATRSASRRSTASRSRRTRTSSSGARSARCSAPG